MAKVKFIFYQILNVIGSVLMIPVIFIFLFHITINKFEPRSYDFELPYICSIIFHVIGICFFILKRNKYGGKIKSNNSYVYYFFEKVGLEILPSELIILWPFQYYFFKINDKKNDNNEAKNVKKNLGILRIPEIYYLIIGLKLTKKLFYTVFIFLICYQTIKYSNENITPSSVSVSGYYRKNGSYVNSYNRRPPGSKDHDFKYEFLRTIFYIIAIGNAIYLVSIVGQFNRKNLLKVMKLDLEFEENLPNYPITKGHISIPKFESVVKIKRSCIECETRLSPGDFFYSFSKDYGNPILCDYCFESRKIKAEKYKLEIVKYKSDLEFSVNERITQFKCLFNKDIGGEYLDNEYLIEIRKICEKNILLKSTNE